MTTCVCLVVTAVFVGTINSKFIQALMDTSDGAEVVMHEYCVLHELRYSLG